MNGCAGLDFPNCVKNEASIAAENPTSFTYLMLYLIMIAKGTIVFIYR